MPFHLKHGNQYVYVKKFDSSDEDENGDYVYEGKKFSDPNIVVKGTLTFDPTGNEKAELDFVPYPSELNSQQSADNRNPQLKETKTGWFLDWNQSDQWVCRLQESTSFVGFKKSGNKIKSARGLWSSVKDENGQDVVPDFYLLPITNPWKDGQTCLLEKGAISMYHTETWEYDECSDLEWEFETITSPPSPPPNPPPSPPPSGGSSPPPGTPPGTPPGSPPKSPAKSSPIWNPTEDGFWSKDNVGMWVYIGIAAVVFLILIFVLMM